MGSRVPDIGGLLGEIRVVLVSNFALRGLWIGGQTNFWKE